MMIDQYVQVRLSWPVVCRMACKACCLNISFDDACEQAIRDYLTPRMAGA